MKKLMILAILVVTALAILDLTYGERVEPDEVYEMTNKKIVWSHEK